MRIPQGKYTVETTVDTGRLAGVAKGKQVVVIKPEKVDTASYIIVGQVVIACIICLCILLHRRSRVGNSEVHTQSPGQ